MHGHTFHIGTTKHHALNKLLMVASYILTAGYELFSALFLVGLNSQIMS